MLLSSIESKVFKLYLILYKAECYFTICSRKQSVLCCSIESRYSDIQYFSVKGTVRTTKDAFIVCCKAAAVPMYRLLIYRRSTHCSKLKINLTLLQYCNAVVGAETVFRTLQLPATQLQWTMNAALEVVCTR